MKKLLISLPLLLIFTISLTFARSNRFDSSIYNQCIQYYQTQRHNAEVQASNWMWFSRNWSTYLNSLPSDTEIETQCEYNAENWEDSDQLYYYQNLGYQAVLRWDYNTALTYYNQALYYTPEWSTSYNRIVSAIIEINSYVESATKFDKRSKYYKLWVDAVKNYNFDDAVDYFEEALEYTNVWSQEYYDTQTVIQNTKNLLKQQDEIKKQEQAQKNWEQWKKYFELWQEELNKVNFDQAIYYFEKSLEYVEKWSETYIKTKELISTIKDAQKTMEEDAKKQSNKEIKTNTEKQSTNDTTKVNNIQKKGSTKDEELKIAIQWMYDNWLTIYNQVQDFMPNDEITREQASKFFVEFAAKVLWKDRWAVYNYNIFSDIWNANPTLKNHIIYANNMWLFKWTNWKFNPFNKLTKAQAIAVTIRMANWYMDENFNPRYFQYFYAADSYWILKWWWFEFDLLDKQNISRWDMALILYNLYLYLNN